MEILLKAQIELLKHIDEAGEFESRLVEKSQGDHEFLQWGMLPTQLDILAEAAVIHLLHQLESENYLETLCKVTDFCSSEYSIKWTLTTKGKQACQIDRHLIRAKHSLGR